MMGANLSLSGLVAETPEHPVQVAPFAIGTHEITTEEYSTFLQLTRGQPPAAPLGEPRMPVHGISWNDAVAYTRWLSEQTGLHYRLPSEAEWEYAASAALELHYWWGPKMEDRRAHCRLNCGLSPSEVAGPVPVGGFAPNPFGLYDTSGNVSEWTADCWNPNYQGAPHDGSAWTTGDCEQRAVRGGSYESPAKSLRHTHRDRLTASTRLPGYGLRVARDLTPEELARVQAAQAQADVESEEKPRPSKIARLAHVPVTRPPYREGRRPGRSNASSKHPRSAANGNRAARRDHSRIPDHPEAPAHRHPRHVFRARGTA